MNRLAEESRGRERVEGKLSRAGTGADVRSDDVRAMQGHRRFRNVIGRQSCEDFDACESRVVQQSPIAARAVDPGAVVVAPPPSGDCLRQRSWQDRHVWQLAMRRNAAEVLVVESILDRNPDAPAGTED